MIVTRKLQMTVCCNTEDAEEKKKKIDDAYKYIRDGQQVHAQMMNEYMSALYLEMLNDLMSDKDLKEFNNLYQRVIESKKGSAFVYDTDMYPTGLPTAGGIPHECNALFDKAMKDGLRYGRVSLPSYKSTTPLPFPKMYISPMADNKREVGFYHTYENPYEFDRAIHHDRDVQLFIKFAHDITFKVYFGDVKKSAELRETISRLLSGEYEPCDSSIVVENKKIFILAAIKLPDKENRLNENRVVGVDLGMSKIAVCALNDDIYKREIIGNYDDFCRQRLNIQKQRRDLNKYLKNTNGGHGRAKKLSKLDYLKKKEKNFAKNYNHYVSKEIINFALRNKAGVIQLEALSLIPAWRKDKFVLRNWSYYQLQTMIEYKAAVNGIKVRYINPAYTSRTCSCCGERGYRISQAVFICSNPDCICKNYRHSKYETHTYTAEFDGEDTDETRNTVETVSGYTMNADFNAARNIAMSKNYTERTAKKQKKAVKEKAA